MFGLEHRPATTREAIVRHVERLQRRAGLERLEAACEG